MFTNHPSPPIVWASWGCGSFLLVTQCPLVHYSLLMVLYALAQRNGHPHSEVLGINLTAAMTFLLICSSVTMVKALEAIQNGNQSRMCTFLGLTILGGLIFLGLQAYEWTHLITHGLTFTTLPHGMSGSTLFWSPPSTQLQVSTVHTSPVGSSTSLLS